MTTMKDVNDFLAKATLKDLAAIQAKVDGLIQDKKAVEKDKVFSLMSKLAADNGFDVTDFMSGKGKTQAKYRNPANPAETWSGRGREPNWAKNLKKQGKLEDAAIKPAA